MIWEIIIFVFILLIIFFAFLIIERYIKNLKKSILVEREAFENKLEKNFEELESTYEELSAMEQELKEHYNELYNNQNQLIEYQEKLQHIAYYDALTDLPNRLFLYEKLEEKLKIAEAKGADSALLFIDADNFKLVNDTLGHIVGDKLLIEISKKLSTLVNDNVILIRLGGDEFIIFIQEAVSKDYVAEIAEKVLQSFRDIYFIDDNNLNVTTSIGIAIYTKDGTSIDELLKNADTAMYRAKAKGKNNYVFFDKYMNKDIVEKMNIQNKLKKAIENQEFELYYQPQFDIKNKKITGFEALVRWNNPSFGVIPPDKFISVAEETGLIVQLGEWIIKEACQFIKKINEIDNNSYNISINVSIVQLVQSNFEELMLRILDEVNIEPRFIELEITESILMESVESNIKKLQLLRERGINIALDDFGKGYSSLSYLRQMPITTLKIDKSFIDEIHTVQTTQSIIESIISIGHKLGLDVVAEGVETQEQLGYLEEGQCNKIQGYLFSRPLSGPQLLDFVYKTEKYHIAQP